MASENVLRATRYAEALLHAGNAAAAIEPLRDGLIEAPDDAYLHLLLSQALLQEKRVEAAAYEADRTVELQPNWADAHIQRARVLLLKQAAKQALSAIETAIEIDPRSASAYLMQARILRHDDKRELAAKSLAQALQIDPFSCDALAEKGYLALAQGRYDEVEAAGREVLDMRPGHVDGLILVGQAKLVQGDREEAMRLALSALANAPLDSDALGLIAAIKMKSNPFGGLWWRWNRLLIKLGTGRSIFLVVGIWVAYRFASLASADLGLGEIAGMVLTGCYLAFVIYTLSAHALVRRMVHKEIERVRIKPDF